MSSPRASACARKEFVPDTEFDAGRGGGVAVRDAAGGTGNVAREVGCWFSFWYEGIGSELARPEINPRARSVRRESMLRLRLTSDGAGERLREVQGLPIYTG